MGVMASGEISVYSSRGEFADIQVLHYRTV